MSADPFALPLSEHENVVYDNPFIRLAEEHATVNGKKELWVRAYGRPSVHVFAINKDGEMLMIKEDRYGEPEPRWGEPRGYIEDGEEPIVAALRELEEEGSYTADHLELLCEMPYLHRRFNEHVYVYIAKELSPISVENPDGDVVLDTKFIPVETLYKQVLNGDFNHTNFMPAFLQYYRELQ